ncbi:MHYT domain-containing protein [Sphaerisporangium rhizosphaerae]|uniref:MHYT domain-containing protein n=1 Tax=Sphaerisporangium rhizosphaerae TaxID=2269375 RepID=A0ABW2P712_9ACTN
MSHIDHFAQGIFTPLAAYVMSVIGSFLSLLLASRARGTHGGARLRWLAGAALALGGTGIWVMHFVAMMGFRVPGTAITYDVPLTIVSALVAVVIVGVGLAVVSWSGERLPALLGAGLLTGLGVAAMHYLGMAAMNMAAVKHYAALPVVASVLIAVVASTVALWFSLRVEGLLATTGAALIMGVAVTGMHYTGMFSLSVTVDRSNTGQMLAGATAMSFLLPLLIGISLVTLVLLLVVTLAPSREELESETRLLAQIEEQRARAGAAAPVAAPPSRPQPPGAGSLFQRRDGREP